VKGHQANCRSLQFIKFQHYCILKEIIFLSLYNILTLLFNSHYICKKVIPKEAAIIVSHSRLLLVNSKQAPIIVSHSHLLLFFGTNNFTPLNFWNNFTSGSPSFKGDIYHSVCLNTLLFTIRYFSVFKFKLFSKMLRIVCLSFHVM